MKKARKFISMLLALVLALSALSMLGAAASTESYPVIYMVGQGQAITDNGKTNGKEIYPIQIPDGYIGDRAKELIAPLFIGLATDDWTAYNESIYNAVMPILSPFSLNENGEVPDNSGCKFSSDSSGRALIPGSNVKRWSFCYDWRLDPIELADQLNSYIQTVKTKAKTDKVSIIARCLSTNIFLAYADKYGTKDIQKCILCCAGFDGFETIGALFSGKVEFDSGAVERFSDSYLSVEDYANDPTFETIREFVTVLQETPFLDFTADTLANLYSHIKEDSYRCIVRDSYGTMPSNWGYIGDEYYDDAKAFLFGGEEEKYASLIEKIDAFHDILVRYDEILDKAEDDGTWFYNVSKYGFQMMPILGADYTMSDTFVSVKCSSIGATCADVDKTLSSAYLESADMKYISPDKQVDASTCKYADHTWFIKNMTHRYMPDSIDALFNAIIKAEGYATVDEVEGYPQFLMADDSGDTIFPATEENTAGPLDRINASPLEALLKLVAKLIRYIIRMIINSQPETPVVPEVPEVIDPM